MAAAEKFAAGLAAAYPDPAAGWDGWERRDGAIWVSGARHLPDPSAWEGVARQFFDGLDWETVEEAEEDDYDGETGLYVLSERDWQEAVAGGAVWVEEIEDDE